MSRMNDEVLIANNMIVDPDLQARLVNMALAAGLGDSPGVISSFIGRVGLPDGSARGFFIRHAADAVLSDAGGNVVLITRLHPPGQGMLAIPGGFLDLVNGVCETAVAAARRELREETGIAGEIVAAAALLGVGSRRYQRGFDLRVAWNDLPDAGISRGNVFMVSTQPVYLRTAVDLRGLALRAGDDAVAACVVNTREMGDVVWAVPDQWGMIKEMPA
jgi:8-oxo-dGTP pyrophosphatase MutT (NUDIX family)